MYCECYFCAESRFLLNKSVGLPGEDSIIYEDRNLFITPDIAPLVAGHFLIVSKKHLFSFASADDSVYISLESAKRHLIDSVFKNENYMFFEHGAVIENSAGSCIDHAHIHALPIKRQDVDSYIKGCGYPFSNKEEYDKKTLQSFYSKKQPYIYYEQKYEGSWLYSVDRLPHQFFRMMVGYFLSIKYNWKLQYNSSNSKSIFNDTLNYGKIDL